MDCSRVLWYLAIHFLNFWTMTNANFLPKTVVIATLGDINGCSSISLPTVAPAIDTAVSELRVKYTGLLNWTHVYLYDRNVKEYGDFQYDSDVVAAQWYYQRKEVPDLIVFIYPGGLEVTNMNRLAAGWNSLMITSAGTGPYQMDKRISPTWVTTGCCSALNFAVPYVFLMAQNNWTSVYMVIDAETPMMPIIAGAVAKAISQRKNTQQTTFTIPIGARNGSYGKLLEEFRRSSRILFFFGHAPALRGLLDKAIDYGMITKDYVYVAIVPYRSLVLFGNFSPPKNSTYTKMQYRSLLLVTIADYVNEPGPTAQKHMAEWKYRSAIKYNCSVYNTVASQVGPHVAGTYYTMLLFAEVLNATLSAEPNFDLRDGAAIARKFFNRTATIDDIPIYVDEFGQRRTDILVKQLDQISGLFRTLLVQSGANQEVTRTAFVDWYGGNRLPPNQPSCGYSGLSSSCAHDGTSSILYVTVPVIIVMLFLAAAAIIGVALWRKRTQEKEWRIQDRDLVCRS